MEVAREVKVATSVGSDGKVKFNLSVMPRIGCSMKVNSSGGVAVTFSTADFLGLSAAPPAAAASSAVDPAPAKPTAAPEAKKPSKPAATAAPSKPEPKSKARDESPKKARKEEGKGNAKPRTVPKEAPAGAHAPSATPGHVQVSVDAAGRVGVWTKTPKTMVHIHSDNSNRPSLVHVSGSTAGYSFTDRTSGLQWDKEKAGERWELSSNERTASFWTPEVGDVISFASSGNVGIGTNKPSCKLDVDGDIKCKSFTQTSSRALKHNIQELQPGMAQQLLQQLQPVKFAYKGEQQQHLGFIAEDVPEQFSSEQHNSVKVMDIVATLTQCVKQQQQQLQAQQMMIQQLQQANQQQQAEVDGLKAHLAKHS